MLYVNNFFEQNQEDASILSSEEWPIPDFSNIPNNLKPQPWAVWIAEPRKGKLGKFNKAPRSPLTGVKIGADKPELFGTFEQAQAAYQTGKYTGIGVLLTGNGIVGFDIDDHVITFANNPDVKAWVEQATKGCSDDAYAELSPSGNGLRLFVGGKLPAQGRKVGSLEIYDDTRFLTVTGKIYPINSTSVKKLPLGQHHVDSYLALLPNPIPNLPAIISSGGIASSATVDALAQTVKSYVPKLWVGDWQSNSKYPSQSEADFAVLGFLAREAVNQNIPENAMHDAVTKAFSKSGLYRPEKELTNVKYAIPKLIAGAIHQSTLSQATSNILGHRGDALTSKNQVESSTQVQPDTYGDIKNARAFASMWQGKLLYVISTSKWLLWKSKGWQWCEKEEPHQYAKIVSNQLMQEAQVVFNVDTDKGKRFIQHAINSHNLPRIEAMLKLAISEPNMAATITELDDNSNLLGVDNGVVNLKTGQLLVNDPSMRITRFCSASYNSGATCDRWLTFLKEVFNADLDTIDTIQRALGYTLTGEITEEVMFICFGFGSNGKSVFNNVVATIYGDYSRMAPSTILTVRRSDDASPRNDLAALAGSRYVSVNELQAGDKLDEQIVKQLAGREPISARFLHKEFFEYIPTFKTWLRTNHKPIITGDDDGIWRRLVLIPFNRKFKDHEKDPYLQETLLTERDGILMWMIEGAMKWRKDGLKLSPKILAEHNTYRTESDLLGEFIADKCKLNPNSKVEQSFLFHQWQFWCSANGVRYNSKASFTRRLNERGFLETKSNGNRYYSGIET